ncbi:cation efflux protein [Cladochytrium replicatum]|nr:cation efflux protein [Cladochytrium replicatum]
MQRKETLHGSQKVVALAITSNLIMFSGKMFSALQSGSASMFAEALHSLADVCNECLLMWGIFRSLRQSDSLHPYGFSREKYAWALVSGVGVFFLGGGVSLYHGISGLLAGHHIVGDVSLAWWVLGGSLLFEGATMTYALKQIARSAKANGVGVLDFIKRGADPTTVQILLEDCAAVAGVAIAGTSLMLSKWLDSPMIDNLGSITIGLLLSSVATFLIQRNIASLVETSMAPERQNVIVRILESDPVVKSVHDVKTTTVGTDWVRFKAEILFNGEEITRRYMSRTPNSLRKDIDELRTLETDEQIEEWIVQHGKGIISTLATEVDRLELNIMSNHPEIKHVDLEIL